MNFSNQFFDKGTILVTGAAGFIGSAIVWHLNSLGYTNIIASDFLGNDNKFLNLVPLQFQDYIEADDLLNLIEKDDDIIKNISCIFHLGACANTTETDCRYLIRNNYEYTKKLAEFALQKGIRFIYASSAATYGDGSQGMDDDEAKIENLRPLNMYAYSKQLFDLYSKKNNFLSKIYGIKYFNVFGPNEYHKGSMRSMILKAYEQIKSSGKVKLFKSKHPDYADGKQMRDFLYIKDAVKMTVHLAKVESIIDKRSTGGLFNFGSSEANTWTDFITPVFGTIGVPVKFEFVDMPEELQNKYQYYTCANIAKLRSIGYTEKISELSESVGDYTANYLMKNNLNLSNKF